MRLTELEPRFLRRDPEDVRVYHIQDVIQGAEGVEFLCPKCFLDNKGPVGTHAVICWSPSVPQTVSPAPGRWNMQGTSFEDLSLVAGSSSVLLQGGCNAHFFVKNGEISWA